MISSRQAEWSSAELLPEFDPDRARSVSIVALNVKELLRTVREQTAVPDAKNLNDFAYVGVRK